MKNLFKVIGIVLLVIITAVALFIATYQPKKHSDFGVFDRLKHQVFSLLQEYHATERAITQDFEDFALTLSFPYSKIFGSTVIGVPLKSFANHAIAAATISQFEVPAKSSYHRDFVLNIRPQYELKAPVFHIDFMKPALGTPGLCSMDFFNVDKETISLSEFFGSDIGNIEKALEIVQRYQRTEKEGRGNITRYLDPYKSPYRIELLEPKTKDEEARKEYYQSVEAALQLILPAYFRCLHNLAADEDYAQKHEAKTKEFLALMYKNDFAIAMGKRIFKEHLKKYWLDGFWNVQMELPE